MFEWWFGVLDFNTVYSVNLTTSRHMAWLNSYLIIKFKSYSSTHSGKKSFTSMPKTAWWKMCILVMIYLLMATIGCVKRFVKCDLCVTFYISSPLNSQVTIWKSLMKDTDKFFFLVVKYTHLPCKTKYSRSYLLLKFCSWFWELPASFVWDWSAVKVIK